MPPISNRILLILFCWFAKASFSQDSFFKKATILKSDSTQLEGYVARISERQISKELEFKETLDQKTPTTLLAPQIERLVFQEDSTVFEKVTYAPRQTDDSTKVCEYRLAKKMVEGYVTLYKMQLLPNETKIIHNISNTYIYFLKIDTSFTVLDQIERRIGVKDAEDAELSSRNLSGYNYMVINYYKKELNHLFRNHPDLLKKVHHLRLKDADIVSIILEFNLTHPERPQKTLRAKDSERIAHAPVLGYTRLPTNAIGLIEFGYQMHIVNPQLSARIAHQIGISLLKTMHSRVGQTETTDYAFKIPVSSRFVFSMGKVTPFAGIGLSQYFGPVEIYGMLDAISGITLDKRVDVTILLEALMPFFQFNPRAPREKHLAIQIGYRFGS
jgi:hypothetical protein